MPAGQSDTGICNIALIELGADPITAMTDPVKRAILCSARYTDVRQEVIRKHPWGCTKKLTQLAASPDAPAFNWANQYALPNDYIRIWGVIDCDGRSLDFSAWQIVGPWLMSDAGAPLNLQYGFDLTDTTAMDALFVKAFAFKLALDIGPALVRDDARLARIEKKFEEILAEAMFVSAQEDSPPEWDVDVLLRSRF